MSIESGLYARLAGDAAVAALVATRIYPAVVPQGATLPAITYQRVAGTSELAHSGPSGLGRARFQVDCWAEAYAAAIDLGEAVRACLHGYRGAFDGAVVGGVVMLDGADGYDPATGVYRRRMDFAIWHSE